MTTAMGPPPPRNPKPSSSSSSITTESEIIDQPQDTSITTTTTTTTTTMIIPMGPEPERTTGPPEPEPIEGKPKSKNSLDPITTASKEQSAKRSSSSVPYKIPEWSGPPCHNYYIEVLKDGSVIDQLDVFEKGAYMFGRIDLCDFILEHPTISRFHSVLQFKRSGDAYLYDLSSTHGTFINKSQIENQVYVELHVGDVMRFGQSSRLYVFQGPTELMPPEKDLKMLREAKIRQEMLDRESSLRRARAEASLADGISWGMQEDAIEEDEDDGDEITWQTYKGKLTEKQEKTRDKIIKRTEKIAHMKKEIDAIRAKDIAQGGLTQGQQTQIARNEQRMTEILEELENLEETLNESIQESIGARVGRKSGGMRKGAAEDDEGFLSDDDEFYDRTKKLSIQKANETRSVETADTLLDKRDAIMKEMEDKKEALLTEKNKMASETAVETEAGDALDAYMSGLSSQLVLDKTLQLEKELAALQSELDRIFFLLKIADPSGEAAKKRDSTVPEVKLNKPEAPVVTTKKQPTAKQKKSSGVGKSIEVSMKKDNTPNSTVAGTESDNKPEADKTLVDAPEVTPYTVVEPQWLGAVDHKEVEETKQEILNLDEANQFVDYKDRQRILLSVDDARNKVDSGIEDAAPGLILRKPKETVRPGISDLDHSPASSVEAKFAAEDAVALLLKHKRGYHAEEEGGGHERQEIRKEQHKKDSKRPKRVLGPEKPSFINSNSDNETWVPPEGQSGDGRTFLNDRYGY
ncbi:kanadaptin [Ricinus communis]|uniref:kanadaptin n=1 Tax=Ricinus communis TaxID=3988 RepID=UPI0007721511|nr:kanadaptin [Ricinus communis]|eukprot:XP_015583501.1 kanadaptin [Ricinus communis]